MAFLHYLFFLQFLLGSVIGEPQIAPELFLNRLNISYGINYEYNGQLNHNIDRVWVVTKIKIPKYEEIRFPNISFDLECKFLDPLKIALWIQYVYMYFHFSGDLEIYILNQIGQCSPNKSFPIQREL